MFPLIAYNFKQGTGKNERAHTRTHKAIKSICEQLSHVRELNIDWIPVFQMASQIHTLYILGWRKNNLLCLWIPMKISQSNERAGEWESKKM